MIRAVAATVAVLLASSAHADAPLGVRTQGTFRELFIDPILTDARPPSQREAELRWSFANDWSAPTTLRRGDAEASLQTDEQADSLTASVTLPWAGRAATSLEWRLTQHWGGWSDPVIETWHRAIHVYNYQRTLNRRDVVHLRLGPTTGPAAIDIGGSRIAWGDVVLRTQVALARGGTSARGESDAWAVSARGDLKLPVGRLADAGGSGGFDAAAGLLATRELTPWLTAHGMLSAAVVSGLPAEAALDARRWQLGAELSLAIHLRGWTLLAEDRVRAAPFVGEWKYDGESLRSSAFAAAFRPQNQLSFGVRRGAFTLWFSEDVTPGAGETQGFYYLSNAPDFAFGVAWRAPR